MTDQEVSQGELLLEDTFTYHDQTSCDMTFKVHDEEYIIFGSIINNELYIFDANAMRSDNQQYTNLQELLINHDY